jgi:glycosyltransferase involved in cell wall biosynthesis
MLSSHPSSPRGRWVGGSAHGPVAAEFAADIERTGLGSRLEHQPEVASVAHALDDARVLVSTALEDPFPLAVLEAGAAGVPVVAFDSGGAAHLLRDAGLHDSVVEVGDLCGLSRSVARHLDDEAEARRRGRVLADHVRRHHAEDDLAARWWTAVCG